MAKTAPQLRARAALHLHTRPTRDSLTKAALPDHISQLLHVVKELLVISPRGSASTGEGHGNRQEG